MASDLSRDLVRRMRAGCRLKSQGQHSTGSDLKRILPQFEDCHQDPEQPSRLSSPPPGRELGGTSLGTNKPADAACLSFPMNAYCFGTRALGYQCRETTEDKPLRALCCSENRRANSKVVIQEEMNSPKNKSPAQLITVLSSALLMSGLLWPEEFSVTLWLSQVQKPQ